MFCNLLYAAYYDNIDKNNLKIICVKIMKNKELMAESETIELKKSTSELKEAIISISAMLNKHQHGEIYFGVKNDGTVSGQMISEKTIRDISKTIADSIEPKVFPEIKKVEIDGKGCIHVVFSGRETPYFAFGRAYMRVGDEDRQISGRELERLILRKNRNEMQWDSHTSEKGISAINESALEHFMKKAELSGRLNFEYVNPATTLSKLGLFKNKKLLNAADIIFCDENKFEYQAAVFAGNDKSKFLDIKLFKGNVYEILEKIELYIRERLNFRVEINRFKRDEIPEIPMGAIREAVINSLCHRDYWRPEGNKIAIYKDRITIYNPGSFPEWLKPEDFINGEQESVLRNPLIAEIFYYSKEIEKWGSGIKRIFDECRDNGVKVEFKNTQSGFYVIFYRPVNEVLQSDSKSKSSPFSSPFSSPLLIELIKENPGITVRKLSEKLDITERAVKKQIAVLKEKGILIRVGNNRSGHWEIIK